MTLPPLVRQLLGHRVARWVVTAAALLLVVPSLVSTCQARRARDQALSTLERVAAQRDSAQLVAAVFQREAELQESHAAEEARRAADAERAAAVARRKADSLAAEDRAHHQALTRAATVRDSLAAALAGWATAELLAAARAAEADSLRLATAAWKTTAAKRDSANTLLHLAVDSLTRQLVREDSADAVVVPVLRDADPPCRILWVAKCPTRTQAAIAGAAAVKFGPKLVRWVVRALR